MDVVVREGWAPGVIGKIVSAHAIYYAHAWGFGPFFEANVAKEIGGFLKRYNAAKDRLFHANGGGSFVGSIVIDGSDPELPDGIAHLRWFVVTGEARGLGTGHLLMKAALQFLDSTRFDKCYLTTFAGLDAARSLYERAGFVLEHEQEAATWGTQVTEQRFVCQLGRGTRAERRD